MSQELEQVTLEDSDTDVDDTPAQADEDNTGDLLVTLQGHLQRALGVIATIIERRDATGSQAAALNGSEARALVEQTERMTRSVSVIERVSSQYGDDDA